MIEEALKHARENPGREICGLVVVFKGREKYIRCRNISENNTSDNFILSPEDYANAEELGEITTIVHSHPITAPFPSEADKVGIETTGLNWLIVNPETGGYSITSPTGYKVPLVGRIFTHGILDCYAIIKDYYKETLNIDLLNFGRQDDWWHKGEKLYRNNYEKAGFIEVNINDIKCHDVLLICNGASEPNHGAVYLGDAKILHHVQGRLSSIDVFGGYWLQNLWKVIRHKDLL